MEIYSEEAGTSHTTKLWFSSAFQCIQYHDWVSNYNFDLRICYAKLEVHGNAQISWEEMKYSTYKIKCGLIFF